MVKDLTFGWAQAYLYESPRYQMFFLEVTAFKVFNLEKCPKKHMKMKSNPQNE